MLAQWDSSTGKAALLFELYFYFVLTILVIYAFIYIININVKAIFEKYGHSS